MTGKETLTLTVRVSNIPQTAVAKDLFNFLESVLGSGTLYAVEIFTEHDNWKSRGHGRVQFDAIEPKLRALHLSHRRELKFKGFYLSISHSLDDIINRPVDPRNRIGDGSCLKLTAGVMVRSDCVGVIESWEGVRVWVMPEKRRIDFFVNQGNEGYKLELHFADVLESNGCCLIEGDQSIRAALMKLKHAPKVFKKVSGPKIATRFCNDRYHICKEDNDFIWVRTTDFSNVKSIGYLSTLCWNIEEGSFALDSLPYYSQDVLKLSFVEGMKFDHTCDLIPLVKNNQVDYEVLFQINSLIHTQKMSLSSVDDDLFQTLCNLDKSTCLQALKEMHKLHSTCYEPKSFILKQSSFPTSKRKYLSPEVRLVEHNIMSCHRVLITPSRIFCLGPELESSNYIVKNFARHATDFMRVTFVDEDWGRLSAGSVSAHIMRGIFSKPHKTRIYHRILSVLRDGITIGDKKFEFLSFSASQLRSNSVWMFASNDQIKAEDVREWMGCFNKIRSISKCAARMGQLFSSSKQTVEVEPHMIDNIPDIETTSDGVTYCFSDGIGKISRPFAREVAKKLGLSHTPSAFQIRYGGYKGVIAVDRNSFRKLSLRNSMMKFESSNIMLNITKWSESQPCYLNREIITLLSTLGVEDSSFLQMQDEQLKQLGKMLTDSEAALNVLESSSGKEMKGIVARMLLQGYEPRSEPYLHTMLQSHLENQLSDLRSRCRVFVPKGRVLVGCLDESGVLEYGQVFARVTMTKAERESSNQTFFQRVDDKTSIVKGKVVVTKNPCLHPGDVRVLEAVVDVKLKEDDLIDCLVFPQKGDRPHPSECSGGDLDGDLYFISWDENIIPPRTVTPMDYTGRRPRIMDHDVTLQEIQTFFADYMISDTLGAISNAHLVHADCEPDKALNPKCLELANLHSMAVDFAKTGAPAEMPRALKPRECPDFMERWEKPMYISQGALGKLYRATVDFVNQMKLNTDLPCDSFDPDLVVEGHESFHETAEKHKEMYLEKLNVLFNYYGAKTEVEILTGNLERSSAYLQYDNRRYGEVKERILVSVKSMMREVKEWLDSECDEAEQQKLASAWYYVTYHPMYSGGSRNCLGFPWAAGDVLLKIKADRMSMRIDYQPDVN